jgi:cytochrome c553
MKEYGVMNVIRMAALGWLLAVAGAAMAAGDATKGQAIASQVCAACHMPDGNSVIPQNPKLSGQHAQYISTQLAHFKSGERNNAIMKGMAANLSAEDMADLGAWFASQAATIDGAKNKELAEAGQKIYRGGKPAMGVPACSGCHSPNGAGIPAQYPRIGGQHAEYISAQLKAFRAGERVNTQMSAIAARLSDKDMEALSEYLSGLH